jgi:homoserine kinase
LPSRRLCGWRDQLSLTGLRARVRVPATSANLGPGFDALGLALSLHDVVAATVTAGGLSINVTGAGAETAVAGEDHLVLRAMRAAFAMIGEQPPGLSLVCVNAIPQGFGLGSSAAAIVAGLLAARALCGERGAERLPDDAVLQLAAGLEGHADNAAACLAGGLTIAWSARSGFRYARLAPLAALVPVLCVPDLPLATVAARQVLPPAVPHADAAQNAARAALLIAALTTDPRTLLDATEDFLHQPYRAAVMPESAALVAALRQAGIPAVISGAGPAVLALTAGGFTPDASAVAAIAGGARQAWTATELQIDRQGAELELP